MGARTAAVRQMVCLMQDARGRFTRIRTAVAEVAQEVRVRRSRRRVRVLAERLALF